MDLEKGKKEINVSLVFKDDGELRDVYSNETVKVKNGKVVVDSNFSIVLLELEKN